MKHIISILLVTLFLSSVTQAKEINTNEVIKKMIKAYGGKSNLLKLNNYKQVWNIEFMTSDKSGFDKREVEMPYKLRTEIVYPERTEVRMINKNSATKIFGGKKTPIKGPMFNAVKLQLMRLYHPLVLKNKLKDLTLTQNKKQYIFILKNGNLTVEYVVSKKTYLIEKAIGRLKMGLHQMQFLTRYEDFRSKGGVLVPHKEIKFVGGMNTAVMVLKEMKFK